MNKITETQGQKEEEKDKISWYKKYCHQIKNKVHFALLNALDTESIMNWKIYQTERHQKNLSILGLAQQSINILKQAKEIDNKTVHDLNEIINLFYYQYWVLSVTNTPIFIEELTKIFAQFEVQIGIHLEE